MLSDEVLNAARGRWRETLAALGVDAGMLSERHGPCPGCGGNDRFRFDDQDGNGTFICSQGGGGLLAGNGIELLAHARGIEWVDALKDLARHFEISGKGAPRAKSGAEPARPQRTRPPRQEVPQFSLEALKTLAGEMAREVDLLWLADRSSYDVSLVSSADFLRSLFFDGEKALVFTSEYSQGDFVWPVDAGRLPVEGKCGVWWLAAPVDGEYHAVGRMGTGKEIKRSRRSAAAVMAYRWLVLESDVAPMREWLGALVKLPLRVAAIYSSGARSLHALVRVDAKTKEEWDAARDDLKPYLCLLGGDPGAMSAVRLTRLPGCLRLGKFKDTGRKNEEGKPLRVYQKYEKPGEQKLLYLNPAAPELALSELLRRRDAIGKLKREAEGWMKTQDVDVLHRLIRQGDFYARVSPAAERVAADAREILEILKKKGAKE
jgi:hypothetical protein